MAWIQRFVLFLCITYHLHFVSGTISGAFYNHVSKKFGAPSAELIARKDLGGGGSFGGGSNGKVA